MSKKVLLTGGGGFFGRRIKEEVAKKGFEVFAPDLPDFDLLDGKASGASDGSRRGHQHRPPAAQPTGGGSGTCPSLGCGRDRWQAHLRQQAVLEPRRRRGSRCGAQHVLKFLFHGIHINLEAVGNGGAVRAAVSLRCSSARAWRRRYLTVLVATPSASAVSRKVRSW